MIVSGKNTCPYPKWTQMSPEHFLRCLDSVVGNNAMLFWLPSLLLFLLSLSIFSYTIIPPLPATLFLLIFLYCTAASCWQCHQYYCWCLCHHCCWQCHHCCIATINIILLLLTLFVGIDITPSFPLLPPFFADLFLYAQLPLLLTVPLP